MRKMWQYFESGASQIRASGVVVDVDTGMAGGMRVVSYDNSSVPEMGEDSRAFGPTRAMEQSIYNL